MRSLHRNLLFVCLGIIGAPPPSAAAPPTRAQSIAPITFEWNARLRHESVGDDALTREATATTLRAQMGARAR